MAMTQRSTFINLQLHQILTEFNHQQHCYGLGDSKYLQGGPMTTVVLSDGVWRVKK